MERNKAFVTTAEEEGRFQLSPPLPLGLWHHWICAASFCPANGKKNPKYGVKLLITLMRWEFPNSSGPFEGRLLLSVVTMNNTSTHLPLQAQTTLLGTVSLLLGERFHEKPFPPPKHNWNLRKILKDFL